MDVLAKNEKLIELKTELNELLDDADGCKDQDEARERIEQDPLEVSIRSDWYTPGETPEPTEFRILLCTGGPAVQIKGELDDQDGTLHARYVNLLSHGNYSLFEPVDMLPENKEIFRKILNDFMSNYRFNPKLFPEDEAQEANI